MVSWASYLAHDFHEVVAFFSEIIFGVFPYSISIFLFLFPAFMMVYGLVRYFHDLFGR